MDLATLNLDVFVSVAANIVIVVGCLVTLKGRSLPIQAGLLVIVAGCIVNFGENLSGDFTRRTIPVGALMVRCGLAYLIMAQVAVNHRKKPDEAIPDIEPPVTPVDERSGGTADHGSP